MIVLSINRQGYQIDPRVYCKCCYFINKCPAVYFYKFLFFFSLFTGVFLSTGSVKCQWKTIADTAKTPDDYIDTTGAVEFAPGARNNTIDIRIVDNNISELQKTFRVELFNAEGGGRF